MNTWILFLIVGTTNLTTDSSVIPGFKSEASCTAAAALTINEIKMIRGVRDVGFICLKQDR